MSKIAYLHIFWMDVFKEDILKFIECSKHPIYYMNIDCIIIRWEGKDVDFKYLVKNAETLGIKLYPDKDKKYGFFCIKNDFVEINKGK